VNGKRDKQGDRDTDEVNGFYFHWIQWVKVSKQTAFAKRCLWPILTHIASIP
jgi:hypothetical protein